jgi:hypothetical protein
MKARFCMAFLLCFFPSVCLAQDSQSFSARVSLSVSANEKIKGSIEGYIASELWSLDGITLTDVNPRWVLSVVALESETKGGLKLGLTLSTVVLEPFDNQYVVSLVSPKSRKAVSSFTSGLYRYSDHWISMGALQDLRTLCENIVVTFDSNHIRPAKESWQAYLDTVRPGLNQAATP